MKNYSVFIIFFLGVIALGGFILYAWRDWTLGVIILFSAVILGSAVVIMKKEVDLWLNRKMEGTLTGKERAYLKESFALMRFLPIEFKADFFRKVHLFKLDKEVIAQNEESRVSYQAVLLCGAYAAFFDEHREIKSPLPHCPVYVFYDHPFPSPAYMKYLHISEYYAEDGALLFSVPHLLKGNDNPVQYFNTALYETVKASMPTPVIRDFPALESLCFFGGYTRQELEKYIGLPAEMIDSFALASVLYFTKPKEFLSRFPGPGDWFQQKYPLP